MSIFLVTSLHLDLNTYLLVMSPKISDAGRNLSTNVLINNVRSQYRSSILYREAARHAKETQNIEMAAEHNLAAENSEKIAKANLTEAEAKHQNDRVETGRSAQYEKNETALSMLGRLLAPHATN